MGVIKNKSDQNIIDNVNELITPSKVREVNDVIDAQVEAAKGSISTLENNVSTLQTNLSTTNTELTTLSQTIQNLGSVLNGGLAGQILSKNSNTDKDTVWIDAPTGGASGDFLPLTGGKMNGDIDMSGTYIFGLNGISTNDETPEMVAINLQQRFFYCPNGIPFGYHSDYSENYTERSLVDKGYVDNLIYETVLPLEGGTMDGSIDMNQQNIQGVDNLFVRTISSINTIDPVVLGNMMQYAEGTYILFTENSLVHKKYVDAQKPKKFKQVFGATGADPIEQLVTHNLGTTEVLAIVRSTEGITDVSYPTLKNVTANSFVFTRASDAGSTEVTVIAFAD